jgi:hypothetical protein
VKHAARSGRSVGSAVKNGERTDARPRRPRQTSLETALPGTRPVWHPRRTMTVQVERATDRNMPKGQSKSLVRIREKRVPLSSSAPPWVLLGVLAFPQGGAPPGKR